MIQLCCIFKSLVHKSTCGWLTWCQLTIQWSHPWVIICIIKLISRGKPTSTLWNTQYSSCHCLPLRTRCWNFEVVYTHYCLILLLLIFFVVPGYHCMYIWVSDYTDLFIWKCPGATQAKVLSDGFTYFFFPSSSYEHISEKIKKIFTRNVILATNCRFLTYCLYDVSFLV